ncbi:MAG: DUF1566 domain-containing protein, partial [Gammaproteobacteria bacterium]|nr:DUF1566 domain-containing protein [Gammaproteobacteria bacterium]
MKQIIKFALMLTVLVTASVEAAYIKVDASGNALADSATSWSCVYDDVSELLWEKKTDDGGIHDKDNTYRWGGIGAEGTGGVRYDDWDSLVNGSNSETLCGVTGWIVPTIGELSTVVVTSSDRTSVDTSFFPHFR